MISMITNCEMELDGKNPHFTKFQISQSSTVDRRRCGNSQACREHQRWDGSVGFRFWRPLARFRKPAQGTFTHAQADTGGKLASTQIITCVHTCTVAEHRRSGSKIRSARNGSDTQFAVSASKPRAPNHHCPREMADPPASAPRICEHTHGSGAGMSKSARLRSATAPRMCERSFKLSEVNLSWGDIVTIIKASTQQGANWLTG